MAKRALVFESNDGMSRALVTGLTQFSDTEVLDVASTPSYALQLLDKHKRGWDVVVVDLTSMAEMALVVVLRACENRLPHQHVLVLAKNASAPVRSVCTMLGADSVFGKDTVMDELFSDCKRLGCTLGPAVSQAEAPGPNT